MDNEIVFLILQGITTLCFFFGVFIINGFRIVLNKLQTSVNDLNISITKLVEKDLSKNQRLDDQRMMIDKMEKEILQLRERYHENVNYSVGKLELLGHEVDSLKKTVEIINTK